MNSNTDQKLKVYPLFGEDLPPLEKEVVTRIFQYLSDTDLYNASLVNRLWSGTAMSDIIWDYNNLFQTTSERILSLDLDEESKPSPFLSQLPVSEGELLL